MKVRHKYVLVMVLFVCCVLAFVFTVKAIGEKLISTKTVTDSVPEKVAVSDEEVEKNTEEISNGEETESADIVGIPDYEGAEVMIHEFSKVDMSYFDDALFIGDSRTVGISEYGGLNNANFFADVGMSVYNVWDTEVSVPSAGKVFLEDLLKQKTYGKVYVMLGINELGYDFDDTVENYGMLISKIQALQPEAIVYIEANMHVTKSRSDSDDIYNNPAIDRFNEAISKFADNKNVFYIDVNQRFDDNSGGLDENYTSDNAHLLGKYYADWSAWLCENAIIL